MSRPETHSPKKLPPIHPGEILNAEKREIRRRFRSM